MEPSGEYLYKTWISAAERRLHRSVLVVMFPSPSVVTAVVFS